MDPRVLRKELNAAFHLEEEKRPLTLLTTTTTTSPKYEAKPEPEPQCISFFDWDSSDSESEATTPTSTSTTTKRWRSNIRKQLPRRDSRADSLMTAESTETATSKTARLFQRLSTYAMLESSSNNSAKREHKDEKASRPRIGSV